MDRIDASKWYTKPKHEHSIIGLGSMVLDLQTCLKANAPIDPTTRQDAIFTIEVARRDIQRCRDHADCMLLLDKLSIALKLHEPYDTDLLDNLDAEINRLEDCREDMRSFRHVRGQGYI